MQNRSLGQFWTLSARIGAKNGSCAIVIGGLSLLQQWIQDKKRIKRL